MKICPRCNRSMTRQKKHRHYWKCRKVRGGCGGIMKFDGSFVIKKPPRKKKN